MEGPGRDRRRVFGEVADLYDRVRPGYPDAVLDELAAVTGVRPGARVLEVGAGTGKATTALADRGLEVVALEPDGRMAEVASRALAGQPQVHIERCTFEEHDAPDGSYDLIVAAQAWHWVGRSSGLARAARLLAPHGWIALLWNTPVERGAATGDLDAVYRRVAPDLVSQWAGSPDSLTPARWGEDLSSGPHFGRVRTRQRRWTRTYTTADYVDLLRTQSTHRLLEPGQRRRLLDAVAGVVDDHGGTVAVTYRCDLYAAPVADVRRGRRP